MEFENIELDLLGYGIPNSLLHSVIAEISSQFNRHATQVRFSAHAPTTHQLVTNYIENGGLKRFLEKNQESQLAKAI